jgi:hypothetical protein
VIFLACPVINGGAWLKDAIRIIRNKDLDVYIAVPN